MAASMILPGNVYAQKIITGKVIGDNAQPVSGAVVINKKTGVKVLTGNDGFYKLEADEKDQIVVSYVGYSEYTFNATNGQLIQLQRSSADLSEVVVTALGIKKETKKISYAIQEVKTADLVKAREPNPINSLKGKVAGLVVNVNSEMLHQP
jgi:hypothetical protein